MSLHHLSPEDRALLVACAARADARRRAEDDPRDGGGAVTWAVAEFAVVLVLIAALLAMGAL